MADVTIRVPTPLRSYTSGADEVTVQGDTVGEALLALGARHAGILDYVLENERTLRRFVNVYLGDRNVNALAGLDTPIDQRAVIAIIPAVAGGSGKRRRLQELRSSIPEVTAVEARELQQRGAVLIDVREPDEIAAGVAAGAQRIVRGFLELRVEETAPDFDTTVVLMCAGGTRSLFAAEDLRRLGYRDVRSLAGGFERWKKEGLPVDTPRVLTAQERERYGRHLSIPEVDEAGQGRLLQSRVLLVGAGGLGSPAALYLAAAGVGTLGLVDDDVVDRSNLQRQILHTDDRVGVDKVASARRTLQALNPGVDVVGYNERLDSSNVESIFAGWDVVVDGADNFPTRYLVNDACVKLALPNVHGSVFRFEGQATVFWPHREESPGPCYRCLYPEPPPPELAPSCAEAGVLGVLPGVIGVVQAVETVKLLLDLGDPLVGRLLQYDALRGRFTELRLERDPGCAYCGDGASFPGYIDYEHFCSAAA
jgi:molybdopterin/thiamine biosynthesis adenylyltransferase/rhodanese-related sulfurtransferase/molybdopterin converting factor small subunit